jgi:hypothetical protein
VQQIRKNAIESLLNLVSQDKVVVNKGKVVKIDHKDKVALTKEEESLLVKVETMHDQLL